MQIWPAIDLRDGKCVRLQQGDYGRETVFSDDPVETAKQWADHGAQHLHLVDLDGARDGHLVNRDAIAAIVRAVDIQCELGGGIRDEQSIRTLLEVGLSRLVVGTKAIKEPDWFREMCRQYPSQLALGIDARGGRVATDGWLETSDVAATDLAAQFSSLPIAAIIYTDISKDGMMAGPNIEAMAEMNSATNLPVVASGGVTTIDDVNRLAELKMAGCIIGRALYEGTITIRGAIDAAQ